jgi:hypothetical protein
MPRDRGPSPDRRVLPSSFVLQLILGGVMTGLLTLAGAALIEPNPALDPAPSLSCTAFQVGSPHPANTRIQLDNAGPERAGVRLDFVDQDGLYSQTVGYNPILNPSTSSEFVFRTPPLGAAVKLSSSGGSLHSRTEILRDDGAPPEIRTASPYLPSDTGSGHGDRPNTGGPQGAAPTAPSLTVQT